MTIEILQDGYPYLPEPDDRRYRNLGEEQVLRDYLNAFITALREYYSLQKTDIDNLAGLVNAGLAGTKVYYVADSSGGAVTRKLTFVDGILTAET